MNKSELMGAIGRGWCTPQNAHKVVDPVLADAIANEVISALSAQTGEAMAWFASDGTGRVIDAKAKRAGDRASAAGAATAIYDIPLFANPPAADFRAVDMDYAEDVALAINLARDSRQQLVSVKEVFAALASVAGK